MSSTSEEYSLVRAPTHEEKPILVKVELCAVVRVLSVDIGQTF